MTSEPKVDDPFIFTLALRPVPEAIKAARDLVAGAWAHWGLTDDYPARLVVSELATNAINASTAGQHVVVRCYLGERGVAVIEVWDESPEPVVMRHVGTRDESGRGVYILDQIALDWQVLRTGEGGKVVRVEMAAGD
ncbi:ATP-binding protein [Spirillospora sp. NPDC047279]|uniref:ATP-binding protein n=1 Tax=Spirillospora sp. NPDC047279 TaxID=3155478 RepID=UPI00340EDFCE